VSRQCIVKINPDTASAAQGVEAVTPAMAWRDALIFEVNLPIDPYSNAPFFPAPPISEPIWRELTKQLAASATIRKTQEPLVLEGGAKRDAPI